MGNCFVAKNEKPVITAKKSQVIDTPKQTEDKPRKSSYKSQKNGELDSNSDHPFEADEVAHLLHTLR